MKYFFKTAGLGLAIGCASVVGAAASTLDFTAYAVNAAAPEGRTGSISLAGVGLVQWWLTTNVGDINYNQAYDGPTPSPAQAAGLALVNDGVGISDDETTTDASDNIYETLTLTFSQSVRITGFHFLDLYLQSGTDPSAPVGEIAIVAWNSNSTSYLANEIAGTNGGYHFGDAAGVGIYTTALTFTADLANDNQGYADFALAAIDVAPIPLPAGGLLLLGALGGLGFARRRKS